MKKETSIAIILGIIFGIFIAVTILYYTQSKSDKNSNLIKNKNQLTPTINIRQNETTPLTISKPKDFLITSQSVIKIEGKSNTNNLLVIQSPYYDKIEKLKKKNFSIPFLLKPGENIIKIYSYNNTVVETQTLKVYFYEK